MTDLTSFESHALLFFLGCAVGAVVGMTILEVLNRVNPRGRS